MYTLVGTQNIIVVLMAYPLPLVPKMKDVLLRYVIILCMAVVWMVIVFHKEMIMRDVLSNYQTQPLRFPIFSFAKTLSNIYKFNNISKCFLYTCV